MSCGHTKFEGSPPCPCDRESVSLVDYGVLKERARIIGLLERRVSDDLPGIISLIECGGED
jgi:hypothetical protein